MRTKWVCALALAACGGSDPSASAVAHDPCAPLTITVDAASAAEQAGISGALDLWRGRGVTAFGASDVIADTSTNASAAPSDPASTIAIQFDPAAETFHGQYDPDSASVLINRDLTGGDDAALPIVIAHELGHAFGLVHIDPAVRLSLMNAGNTVTLPTDADQQALAALWGACPAAQ